MFADSGEMMENNTEKLFVATANAGKLREIRDLLKGIEVFGLRDLPFHIDIVEDGDTFRANSLKKANVLMERLGVPVLADDSGLVVDALGGRPGVYSARFAGENASDEENTQKLLLELSAVEDKDRTARFVCVMCLVMPDGTAHYAEGESEGIILRAPKGENGFGYDPVFYVPEFDKTFSELTLEEKNSISHRARALSKMREIIERILS